MYPEMKGKVALVTGGSSGIGLATVAAFVREGATVILASRNETRARAALESLKAGKKVSWIQCDVSKGKDVEKLCAAIKKQHGRLDYAFNNGGSGGHVGPVASGNETGWRKTMDGYLTSAFLCLRYQIPLMLEQGRDEEEAAATLGASGFQTFRRVTLPNVKWALLAGVLLCNARAMGEFGAVSVVSGHIRGLTNTLPLHVEILYNEYNFQAAFAVASLLAFLALITLLLKVIVERRSIQA